MPAPFTDPIPFRRGPSGPLSATRVSRTADRCGAPSPEPRGRADLPLDAGLEGRSTRRQGYGAFRYRPGYPRMRSLRAAHHGPNAAPEIARPGRTAIGAGDVRDRSRKPRPLLRVPVPENRGEGSRRGGPVRPFRASAFGTHPDAPTGPGPHQVRRVRRRPDWHLPFLLRWAPCRRTSGGHGGPTAAWIPFEHRDRGLPRPGGGSGERHGSGP